MSDWSDVDPGDLAASLYRLRAAAQHGVAALAVLQAAADQITERYRDEEEDVD